MLDWLGSISVMGGLILSGRKNICCWPVWLAGNICWIIFGLQAGLLSIVVLNVAFIIANIIGWKAWAKDRNG